MYRVFCVSVVSALFLGFLPACTNVVSSDNLSRRVSSKPDDHWGRNRPSLSYTLAKDLVLVHDQTLVVDVKITRKPPFTGGMTITARGLPAGLTSEPIDVTPLESTVKLKLIVAKNLVQGPLKNVSVEATVANAAIGNLIARNVRPLAQGR